MPQNLLRTLVTATSRMPICRIYRHNSNHEYAEASIFTLSRPDHMYADPTHHIGRGQASYFGSGVRAEGLKPEPRSVDSGGVVLNCGGLQAPQQGPGRSHGC